MHMTSEAEPVTAGVVGVGEMGQHHARVYDTLPGVDLVGVYDDDTDRATEIAKTHRTSVMALESLLDRVDLASIVVPTQYHYEVAMQAIEHGVDILVEKPLVSDQRQGADLIEQATERGVIIQVGHIERFNPAIQTLHRVIEDEELIGIETRRLGPPRDRMIDDTVVTDLMVHDIDVALSLVDGEVESVSAMSPYASRPDAVNDYTTATLQFTDGTTVSHIASRTTQKTTRELTVTTRTKVIEVRYLDQHVEIYRKSDPAYVQDDGAVRYREQTTVEVPFVDTEEPLVNELQSFVDTVRTGGEPVVSATTGLTVVELAQQIEQEVLAT
uniref:Probable oxidoreductase n=1 Tax=uncultured haloarchaeon TaxID=160804 RepID=A5YSP8_9EURY|nr:probable oxidoreductase [uncultured haloarchaeon]